MTLLGIIGLILMGCGGVCTAGDKFIRADRELKDYRSERQKENHENEEA